MWAPVILTIGLIFWRMSLTVINFTQKSGYIPYMVTMMRMPQSMCHSLCLTKLNGSKGMITPLSLCSHGAT